MGFDICIALAKPLEAFCRSYGQTLSSAQTNGAPPPDTQQPLQQSDAPEHGSPTPLHIDGGVGSVGPANPRRAASVESVAIAATTTPALSPSIPVKSRRRFERMATDLANESKRRSSMIDRSLEKVIAKRTRNFRSTDCHSA
jgi:hypothetical protein